ICHLRLNAADSNSPIFVNDDLLSASAPLGADEGSAIGDGTFIEGAAERAGAVKLTAADSDATEAEIPALRQEFILFLQFFPTSPFPTLLSITLGHPSFASGTYVCWVKHTRVFLCYRRRVGFAQTLRRKKESTAITKFFSVSQAPKQPK